MAKSRFGAKEELSSVLCVDIRVVVRRLLLSLSCMMHLLRIVVCIIESCAVWEIPAVYGSNST